MLHVPPGEVLTAKEGPKGSVSSERLQLESEGYPAGGAGLGQARPLVPTTYLASRVRAMMPAARGADAEVPV